MKFVFRVENMHCTNCAMRLEGLEEELPGIQRIRASYHKQQMEVECDLQKVSLEQIIQAADDLGYVLKIKE